MTRRFQLQNWLLKLSFKTVRTDNPLSISGDGWKHWRVERSLFNRPLMFLARALQPRDLRGRQA